MNFVKPLLFEDNNGIFLRYKTSPVSGNSINPVWNEGPFVFKKVVLPNLAHLRFCVYDENGKMLGHRVIPVRGLRPGYRHIHLRNEINQPAPLATLFIYLEVRDYVPDDFSGKPKTRGRCIRRGLLLVRLRVIYD